MIVGFRPIKMLTKWVQLARWPDWSTSKLPFLGAAAILLAPEDTPAIRVVAAIGMVLSWAAFGYCVNDVADQVSDFQASKVNRASDVSVKGWALFLTVTAGSSIGLSLLWTADLAAPILVLAGLLLASAYSLPPVRLKERGATGLVAGAVSQWVLPVLAISAAEPQGWISLDAWCLALLGLAIGIRWMAVHQLQDALADRRAGVRTYAAGGAQVLPVLWGAFFAEATFLTATLVLTWPRSVPATAGLLFWIGQQALLRPAGEPFSQRLQGYDHAPLAEYYFLFLPATLAVARAPSAPAFLWVAAIFVALGWCYLDMMIGEWHEVWNDRKRQT